VSLLTGFVLAFPYILLEVFAFINPGLKRRERILLLTSIPAATLLFIAGVSFAYFVMLPAALPFLLNFLGIQTVPRPSNYISFTTNLLFWIGVSFTFPDHVRPGQRGMVRSGLLEGCASPSSASPSGGGDHPDRRPGQHVAADAADGGPLRPEHPAGGRRSAPVRRSARPDPDPTSSTFKEPGKPSDA
jgi:hypothetical protein